MERLVWLCGLGNNDDNDDNDEGNNNDANVDNDDNVDNNVLVDDNWCWCCYVGRLE